MKCTKESFVASTVLFFFFSNAEDLFRTPPDCTNKVEMLEKIDPRELMLKDLKSRATWQDKGVEFDDGRAGYQVSESQVSFAEVNIGIEWVVRFLIFVWSKILECLQQYTHFDDDIWRLYRHKCDDVW